MNNKIKTTLVLTLALSILPSLVCTFILDASPLRFAPVQADFECTTDLDCECKSVPYEELNNSDACIAYRGEK